MGFCPKLNLFWHNKHNGLQSFYECWVFFIFHFLDIFNVFIIGNNFFSFNLFSEDELTYWSLEVMRKYCKDWRKTLGMWNNRKSRELIGEWSYYAFVHQVLVKETLYVNLNIILTNLLSIDDKNVWLTLWFI